jgi:large subunit ribosomal protein L11
MARKNILRTVKLQLRAGEAGPAEVGKMLGPYGVNLREIIQRYNEATASARGDIVPVEVTVFDDRSFALRLLTPPTSFLLRRAAGIERGAARPAAGGNGGASGPGEGGSGDGAPPANTVTMAQLREIALRKMPDLNTDDVAAAMRSIAGTARSMGLRVLP